MRLPEDTRRLLSRARLGMLALRAREPLVNPSAYHFDGESVWMTTSRYAAKLAIARRDPRVAFLVSGPNHAVLLRGVVEAYDPRSLSAGIRAVMHGRSLLAGMAGYALKNTNFVGGYLLDLAGVPAEWWPHNRVVLRMRATAATVVPVSTSGSARPARMAWVPAAVGRALERTATAYMCWVASGSPLLVPCRWALCDGSLVTEPLTDSPLPRGDVPGAVVVEYHHPFRATRMVGACVRGVLGSAPAGAEGEIAERYREVVERPVFRLQPSRVTRWRGFEVSTAPAGSAARKPVAKEEVGTQPAR